MFSSEPELWCFVLMAFLMSLALLTGTSDAIRSESHISHRRYINTLVIAFGHRLRIIKLKNSYIFMGANVGVTLQHLWPSS